ncbi:MAG: enoyl-CoA hydratase-related protein [Proteobacteria bacterium]|nr:enoyl-CoA hydratase-related protein [Pseudomonadota bacterium]
MSDRNLSEHREDDFAVITLERPDIRNTLSETLLSELGDALRRAGTSDARGVILAAQGPVFSAGHDFRDLNGRDTAAMTELLTHCRKTMTAIQEIPQPVIAQVEGLATAGGCQLVAHCDLAVAGESSAFAVPGGRGGWFCTTPGVPLARAVGRKRALEMLMTGDPIDAATACDWGLVNRVVPDAEVPNATRQLLARATRGSAASKGIGKQAFYEHVDLGMDAAYDLAVGVMAESSQHPDAQESIRAFLARKKRKG